MDAIDSQAFPVAETLSDVYAAIGALIDAARAALKDAT